MGIDINLKSKRPLIISGPCSAETQEQLSETVEQIVRTGKIDIIRAGIWKPRTHPGAFEGIGEEGLKWISELKKTINIPFTVEVANAKHVELALRYGIDVLWIGARTTVSPFAVQEIADALRSYPDAKVLIKNPVNPDIELWVGGVQRILDSGIKRENVGLIHRGFSSYGQQKYRNKPMWAIALEMKRRFPDMIMICDPSHISGNSEYIEEICQVAANLDFDGLMIESHICPSKALSDSKQQLTPAELEAVLNSIQWRSDYADDEEFIQSIERFRREIDEIDISILELLSHRMKISDKIGEIKKENNVAILQQARWSDVLNNAIDKSVELGLSKKFITRILDLIHLESIRHQNNVLGSHTDSLSR